MSSYAEMAGMVTEAAEAAGTPNWKDRVQAAARILNLPFSRAKAFYYRAPRRVDAGEMDNARAAIRELREQRRTRRHAEHLDWLASEIERHRTAGQDFRGPHVDGLEHLLRMARAEIGAVDVQTKD